MKKSWFILILFFLILAINSNIVLADEKDDKIRQLESQIEQYNQEIVKKQSEAQSLSNQISIFELQVKQTQAEIDATNLSIKQLTSAINQKEKNISEKEKEIEDKNVLLARYLRQVQRSDQGSLLEFLLKNRRFSDFFNDLNSISNIQNQIHDTLLKIKDLKEKLVKEKDDLESDKAEQEQLKHIQNKQKTALEAAKKGKQKLLDQTKGQEKTYQQLIAKTRADIEAIKNGINLGITHLDTAENYANGHSEELLGEAIKNFDRSKLFIVSKVGRTKLKHDDLIKSCKESLQRIGTTYLDLFLIHAPSLEIPIEESMKAMNELYDEGLIKNIGVSNFSVGRMIDAQKYSRAKIVANQLHLNLKYRETELKGLIKHCQENDVMFIAWRPVQKGTILDGNIKIMEEMCKKYDKTPSQIAINWLISQDNIVTLSKTRSLAHLQENLGAIGWEMAKDDIERLRVEFPDQQSVSDVVPLV